MNSLPEINLKYLNSKLIDLLNVPSPTGFTEEVFNYLENSLKGYQGLKINRTAKGGLTAAWDCGRPEGMRGLTAHLDTLGAMVKEIKANGRLRLSRIGGYAWNTIEGEGCWVRTRQGELIPGSILVTKASAHIHSKKVSETERSEKTMEVRMDIPVSSESDSRNAGVEVGDFVFLTPRVEEHNGFIRSRHLDDKAGVACILAGIQALMENGMEPALDTVFHFSNYEEVGHGAASGFPAGMKELVAVDMAAVGEGQTSDEYHATLCVKDSGGPYHFGLNERLKKMAEKYQIPHRVDIYPHYGSDGEAYWRAGGDVEVALIGPGVDASHNYERTHQKALAATTKWIMAYLIN